MFNTLKKELNLVEVAEYVTDIEYKKVGEDTWIPEGDECPSCGHKNCFRIKHNGNNEESIARCFSESLTWDVTSFVAKLKEISNVEAAKLLAKHYNVSLPHDYSPIQEVMNLAANYYRERLLDSGPHAELNGLTPTEYQREVRHHTDESLITFQVGWTDGKLVEYLESVGISKEMISESGLSNSKGRDFFPTKMFIYPHLVRGRVSHFTIKDVLKQKIFQLKNQYKLNGHSYYNSDSISKPGPVAVVEGENDVISLIEAGWDSGAICCNGSISTAQLEWLTINLKDRDVVTFFDNDPAGSTYREKVGKLRKSFKSLVQVSVSGQCKDIDEYLKKGADLSSLLESAMASVETSSSVQVEGGSEEASPILEKDGSYFKVVYKDGNESLRQLSNFTIQLLNVYLRGEEREREITITLSSGRKSKPFRVSSEAKHSLKSFKTLIANALDGSFYGNEIDLGAVWEKIYKTQIEREVTLIEHAGRIEKYSGWMFKDCFIADSGGIYYPDENGVMWIGGNTSGIKPVSIIASESISGNQIGVPSILTDLDQTERKKLIGTILNAIAANLGDMGEALNILAFCHATVYSKIIYDELNFFPLFQFFGTYGKGKSTIVRLMLRIFNMEEVAYNSMSNINSGVALSRKMAYYVSLPMCIDEIRQDNITQEWYSVFRSWYDRANRTIGDKNGNGVRAFDVNTSMIFGGEDTFDDPALQSRCIPVRIRKNGRELVKSYRTIVESEPITKAIGYEWILGYKDIKKKELIEEITSCSRYLSSAGVDSRQARNWAVVAVFAAKLNKEYCPEFNYLEYIGKIAKNTQEKQSEDSTLMQFWMDVSGMQSEERASINSDHMRRVDNKLYIWYPEVYRMFVRNCSYGNRVKFSKNAILAALKEEEYYVGDERIQLGMAGNYRRCQVIDLQKCSETIREIADFLDN